MVTTYTVRPISDRTTFTGKHIRSPFQSGWMATRDLLLREVRQLQGRDLVLEVDVTEGAIRLDGQLYANARPSTPAVRVAFDSMHGPLVYATDRFTTWQDNVRAIALGLEALRKVDRYGITKRGEQYTGWKQLPGGSGPEPPHMTADEAVRILHTAADVVGQNVEPGLTHGWSIDKVYRRARGASHPDRHNGDRMLWDQVERAADVLGLAR